jgi:hypothetical protein
VIILFAVQSEFGFGKSVTGYIEIEKEQMGFFQTFLEHRMNFDKYEYCFWGEK